MTESELDRVANGLARYIDKVVCQQQMKCRVVSPVWIKKSTRALMSAGLAAINLAVPCDGSEPVFEKAQSAVAVILAAFLARRGYSDTLKSKFGDVIDCLQLAGRKKRVDGDDDDDDGGGDRLELAEKLVCVCEENDFDNLTKNISEHLFRCIDVCTIIDVDLPSHRCSDDDDACSDDDDACSDDDDVCSDDDDDGDGRSEIDDSCDDAGAEEDDDAEDDDDAEEEDDDAEDDAEEDDDAGEDDDAEEEDDVGVKRKRDDSDGSDDDDDGEDCTELLTAAAAACNRHHNCH